MRVAIAAEGGRQVGLGHLGRCLALAQAIQELHGIRATFITSDPASRSWLRQKGFSTESLDGRLWDILIGDSYRFSPHEFRRLRSSTGTLTLVDDLGLVRESCDWILNSSIGANTLSYPHVKDCSLLLGPRFHPLRKEFWQPRSSRTAAPSVKNALIILGGGDGWGSLGLVAEIAQKALPRATWHVITGPLSSLPPRSLGGACVVLHRSPQNVRAIMEACDMAISGGGQTLYELAFTGLPTIAITLADNQIRNVAGFESAGTLLSSGQLESPLFERRLLRLTRRLAEDLGGRQRMTQAGRRLVDSRGAFRVVCALFGERGYGKN